MSLLIHIKFKSQVHIKVYKCGQVIEILPILVSYFKKCV